MAGNLVPPDSTSNKSDSFATRDWVFLGLLSAAGLILGLRGILHYGYIGQDFAFHRDLILSFPRGFGYGPSDPPGLYWFGSAVRGWVSSSHYLEATSLAFLLLNAGALWIVYGFLWAGIRNGPLRYSAAALATFVPFRIIHSIVLAADAFTLPVFAVAAVFTLRLFKEPRNAVSWIGLSLSLSAGLFFKYTLVGLLPPVALLSGVAIWKRAAKGERFRWCTVGGLALAIPACVFVLQVRECAKANGDLAGNQWLPRGAPPVMRWSDILTLKRNDLRLLSAPDYLGGELYGFRRYSYMALVHASSFTDVLECFQPPKQPMAPGWGDRTQEPFARERSALSQGLQVAAVRLCIVHSALAVAGTLFAVGLCALSLLMRRPVVADTTVVMAALATGFYSTIFFSLHRLGDPYTAGFWLPRLVLPALVIFFCLGFVSLDFAFQHMNRGRKIFGRLLAALAGYTLLACLLFIGFLF